jgi:hypothetical protein
VALVTTARGDGEAVLAPLEDNVVVVALVDAVAAPLMDTLDVPVPDDGEDPHPVTARAIAVTTDRVIGWSRLDRRDNIPQAVCCETQTSAEPAVLRSGPGRVS